MFYSQCGEDKMLYEKYFKNYSLKGQKYYLEMGALDGVLFSNTKFYEDTLNWTGILVEPNPFVYSTLASNRPNNILMSAICSDQKEALSFSICVNAPAVCSLKMTEPKNFDTGFYASSKMITMKTIPTTLDDIIGKSGLERIDLCVIDVEGHEVNVLNSFSFKIPVVLWLIEISGTDEKNQHVIKIMKENKCKFIEKCAHNMIFIHEDYLKYFSIILY